MVGAFPAAGREAAAEAVGEHGRGLAEGHRAFSESFVRRLVTVWTSSWVSPAGQVSIRPTAPDAVAAGHDIREPVGQMRRPVDHCPVVEHRPVDFAHRGGCQAAHRTLGCSRISGPRCLGLALGEGEWQGESDRHKRRRSGRPPGKNPGGLFVMRSSCISSSSRYRELSLEARH